MAHPLEAISREGYAAFGRGDVEGYLQICTEDFIFQVPGRSKISGKFAGKEGIWRLAALAMEITAGTFQEEVEDVLANDEHAVVLARHRFTRGGDSHDYRTAHVYEIRGGKLSHCYEQPRDADSFHSAWGPGDA